MEKTFEIEMNLMVRISYTPVRGCLATHDDPGYSEEMEDIDIEALPFDQQPEDIRRYIEEQCAEDAEDFDIY